LVDRIIDEMNPVSPRSAGVGFDNCAALPGERIAAIRAPTLIVHAADDTLQPYHNAEFAAATIPGAVLVRFESGGHLLMAVEQAEIRAAVQKQILEYALAQFVSHTSASADVEIGGIGTPDRQGESSASRTLDRLSLDSWEKDAQKAVACGSKA
jgi:hypothetical protein